MFVKRLPARTFLMSLALGGSLVGLLGTAPQPPDSPAPAASDGRVPDAPAKVWVYFADKGLATFEELSAALASVESGYNPRAIERRKLRRSDAGVFDERDVPVKSEYLAAVTATGARVDVVSRWLNAASVHATQEQIAALRGLAHVAKVEPVRAGRRGMTEDPVFVGGGPGTRGFYGYAEAQTNQINLIALHDAGFSGQGVIVGILDTGFHRSHAAFNEPGHVLSVVAEHDFINDDGNTDIEAGDDGGQHSHGTLILSVLGAYKPGELVGGAYNASFILCKTEDITGETPIEEDYYVEGLEFIEANGGDMATSSLGYIDWYTQADLDGATAVTTVAVNVATANGVFCCTAAGNEGHDGNPATSHLIAPADALRVITVGAADEFGTLAGFSSDGPTADGRLKPEVLARGVATACVWPHNDTDYASANGTSLSTPVVAGAVACLIGARPAWSVDRMRAYLFATASDQVANGQPDPLGERGHGVINAMSAFTTGCPADFNGDLFIDPLDYNGFINAFESGSMTADFNGDGFLDPLDYNGFINAFEAGC